VNIELSPVEAQAIHLALHKLWDELLNADDHDRLTDTNLFYKVGNSLVADLAQRFEDLLAQAEIT
jgi:hypothetical protein